MKYLAFLKYQIIHYILRWRWILPIPVGLCLGYWAGKVIQAQSPLNATSFSTQGNALEAFIWAFGKPEIVYFVISILWIFLISDLTPENTFGQYALIRLRLRRTWWSGKVVHLLVSTLVYTALLLIGFFLPVLVKYPLVRDWSAASIDNFGIYLGYSIMNGGPLQASWRILVFLVIGWFALGLLILIINLISQRRWFGFLSGVIIIICSKLGPIRGGPIGGDGLNSFLLLQNHLEYTPLWVPTRIISEMYSWLFWLVWILICLLVGYAIINRHDFYVKD